MMRRFLIVLAVALFPAVAFADTSDGVENSCNFNNSNTCNIALTGVTAESAIIVSSASSVQHTTMTASDGTNTYANALVTGAGPSVGTIVACNVAGGNPTITVTVSTAVFGVARAKEVKNAALSECLEGRMSNSQSSVGTSADAITSGTIGTPAAGGAYVYGVTAQNCCAQPTITAGTGLTSDIDGNDSGDRSLSAYLIQGAPASAVATFTTSIAGNNYETHGLVIRAAIPILVGCRVAQDGTSKRLAQNGTDFRIVQGGTLSSCGGGKGFPFRDDPFEHMIVR